MEFLSNENKYLLWSVLQESDVFQNIPNEKYQEINGIFENVLIEYNKTQDTSSIDIVSMNKEVIPLLLSKVHAISNSQQNKKLQVVYRSEDIKKQREEEFNEKMSLKQSNMNELLQPKKPKEVSFADAKEDKPLGGDMDRLIQDMLSSRERELESLNSRSIEDAKKWIGMPESTSVNEDKLKEDVSTKQPFLSNENNNMPASNFVSIETIEGNEPVVEQKNEVIVQESKKITESPNIMNMFKKKDFQKEILEELKEIKSNQYELMEKINSLLQTSQEVPYKN